MGNIFLQGDQVDSNIQYRQVDQPSVDGNTVDIHKEKSAFAENTVRYQATVDFLGRKFSGLKNAFKGE